jgi:hypothetical protein
MKTMSRKPNLKLVKPRGNGTAPPRKLGQHGQSLWDRVMSEYDLEDVAGRELLTLACRALDRAETCRALVDREGAIKPALIPVICRSTLP